MFDMLPYMFDRVPYPLPLFWKERNILNIDKRVLMGDRHSWDELITQGLISSIERDPLLRKPSALRVKEAAAVRADRQYQDRGSRAAGRRGSWQCASFRGSRRPEAPTSTSAICAVLP